MNTTCPVPWVVSKSWRRWLQSAVRAQASYRLKPGLLGVTQCLADVAKLLRPKAVHPCRVTYHRGSPTEVPKQYP